MKASRLVTLVMGMVLAVTAGAFAAWEYADAVIYSSGSSGSWNWLEGDGQYAKYEFRGLGTDQQWLLFDILVSISAVAGSEPSPEQSVRLKFRPTGGSWSSREVGLHLRRRDGAELIYQGQVVLSRRTLGIGTNLDVLLEPASWRQGVGVYEGSVRVLHSPPDGREAMQPDQETDPIRHAVMVGGTAGQEEPPATEVKRAVGVHSGELGPVADEPLCYGLPLASGQRLWLQVDFTGGGALELVCPDGETMASVDGTGKLSIFYTATTSGRWSVLLRRESPDEVSYRLRIEIEG